MIARRSLLAAIPAIAAAGVLASTPVSPVLAAPVPFPNFLAGLRAEARRAGISSSTLERALTGIEPNPKVLEKIRHQPEFTMTWAQYRAMLVTEQRIDQGRAAWSADRALLGRVRQQFGVSPAVILGIWGLESNFGTKTGDYRVVESLATLAWDSARPAFFRSELIAALKILDHGDVVPARMTGSYAGAMGQPQFMPSSYLRYAVDFTGNGGRDIWTSVPDVLASIANYLARSGWRAGEGWGTQVMLPPGFDPDLADRNSRRPIAVWRQLGVRGMGGRPVAGEGEAALVLPDGAGGEAFLVTGNFSAIRRYNPSDFYALVVGLLGDRILT